MPNFLTSDQLSLHYEDTGSGLPVLCLSGLTRNARDFDFVAPHLTGIRMIRLDYRGRGQSQWSPDPLTYTVPREAQDVLELMDHSWHIARRADRNGSGGHGKAPSAGRGPQ